MTPSTLFVGKRENKLTVLILSREQDGHIAPVAQILRERGCDVLRIDLADIPLNVSIASTLQSEGWAGTLTYQDRSLDVVQIKSVWWRRPTSPIAPPSYPATEAEFWVRENERGFISLLLPPPGVVQPFWVSNPDAIHHAARKPRQLATAQALELAIPKTIMTNDPAEAKAFYEACDGQIIAKAICRGVLDPEGEYIPGQERFIYTTEITPEHLAQIDRIHVMLHLFQQRIQKEMDLRVIVVGKQVFAIEIHSPKEGIASLDWRRDYGTITYAVHQLPKDVEQKLVQMVCAFELQFSSMDVILSKDGEYVFIEQNPNGQFLWPSRATGLPLAEVMGNLLMYPEEFAL